MERAHGASRDILLLYVGNMWSQCVSAPSEEVCISLRVCSLPYFSPPPLPLLLFSLIFSACRSRRLFSRKDATSVHCAVTLRPSFLQNESIGRPPVWRTKELSRRDGRYFSRKYREFYSNIENKFLPLFREKKRISFLFNKRELISNLF